MRPNSCDLVSIAVDIDGEKYLKKVNNKNNITEIIKTLIEEYDLSSDIVEYGLRLTHIKNKKCPPQYITDENKFKLIQDGNEVKLIDAPRIHLGAIFMDIYSKDNRNTGYVLLNAELHDDVILKLITELGWHIDIIHKAVNDLTLTDYEIMVSFNVVYKLLKRKYITNVSAEIVQKAINCIKAKKKPKLIYSTLLLIRQLLSMKIHFNQIFCNLSIDDDLISILHYRNEALLQFIVLSVINVIVKLCSKEQRKDVIKIMNQKKCLQTIFDDVIDVEKKLTKDIEKELHYYQTYILRVYRERLLTKIDISDQHNPQIEYLNEDLSLLLNQNVYNRTISTFENDFSDEKESEKSYSLRFSLFENLPSEIISMFNEDDINSLNSSEHIFEGSMPCVPSPDTENVSVAMSLKSENERSSFLKEWSSRPNSMRSSVASVTNEDLLDVLTDAVSYHDKSTKLISQLTLDCLVYFKENYPQTFHVALLEENEYGLGFYFISEQICSILCSQLRIGQDPCKGSTLYCPIIFNTKQRPFVMEIFCRLYWLFVRTRIEMHAKTIDDQEKVLNVLKTQYKLVLSTKPRAYNDVMAAMRTFTYAFVKIKWDREQKLKWKRILKDNPSVQELAKRIEPEIEELIHKKRLNYLNTGDKLYRTDSDKKMKQQLIYMRLSANQKQLIFSDWNSDLEICSFDLTPIDISDINYLVTGDACLHVKEHRAKKPEYAFSLLLNEISYEFEALSEEQYNKWVDGLHILLGKKMSSKTFCEEKSQLIETELLLMLLDVENVPLPIEAPPIPPPPPNYNFTDNSIVL